MARQVDIFNNPYYSAISSGIQQGAGFATEVAAAQPGFYTGVNAPQSYGGRPVYTIGQNVADTNGFHVGNYGRGLVGKGAITGASIGANPALVAATGGGSIAIGAAVGAMGGGFAKNRVQKKADKMNMERWGNIKAAQQSFNSANTEYNRNYLARQQYEQQFK